MRLICLAATIWLAVLLCGCSERNPDGVHWRSVPVKSVLQGKWDKKGRPGPFLGVLFGPSSRLGGSIEGEQKGRRLMATGKYDLKDDATLELDFTMHHPHLLPEDGPPRDEWTLKQFQNALKPGTYDVRAEHNRPQDSGGDGEFRLTLTASDGKQWQLYRPAKGGTGWR
jgi:hypothetical protein